MFCLYFEVVLCQSPSELDLNSTNIHVSLMMGQSPLLPDKVVTFNLVVEALRVRRQRAVHTVNSNPDISAQEWFLIIRDSVGAPCGPKPRNPFLGAEKPNHRPNKIRLRDSYRIGKKRSIMEVLFDFIVGARPTIESIVRQFTKSVPSPTA